MSRLWLALAICGFASGQNSPEIVRAAKSPYTLARYINSHGGFDWEPLWKALGLTAVSLQPCGEPSDSAAGCSTEIFTVLDPDQAILLIQEPYVTSQDDIYLQFRQDATGEWRFSGSYSAEILHYRRRHEIARIGGKPYLRVSRQGIRGSDVDEEREDWLDLSRDEFQPVFSFPVQASENRNGFGISRRLQGSATPSENRILLSVDVEFYWYEGSLGHISYTSEYTRGQAGRFKLQKVSASPGDSAISDAEFEQLADVGSDLPNEKMAIWTLPGLTELATKGSKDAKGWLRMMLGYCHDTPEVRNLRRLVGER